MRGGRGDRDRECWGRDGRGQEGRCPQAVSRQREGWWGPHPWVQSRLHHRRALRPGAGCSALRVVPLVSCLKLGQ